MIYMFLSNNPSSWNINSSNLSCYSINLQDSSFSHVFTSRVENCMDPDQLVSQKPADLDLHYFHKRIYAGLVL